MILWCDGQKEQEYVKNKRKQVELDSEESDEEEDDYQTIKNESINSTTKIWRR